MVANVIFLDSKCKADVIACFGVQLFRTYIGAVLPIPMVANELREMPKLKNPLLHLQCLVMFVSEIDDLCHV